MNKKALTQQFILIFVMLLSSFEGAAFCGAYSLPALQEKSEWAKYIARGEEFSVLLPEAPTMALARRPDKKNTARYEARIYAAYGDGIVYVITSESNPKQGEKLETFIAEFRETLPRHKSKGSSELRFDREIDLKNFSGKRYRVTFYNGIEGIVDFFMTNDHVYIVKAVGANESNPSMQRFLRSFSLGANGVGKDDAQSTARLPASSELKPITNQEAQQIFSPKEVTRSAFAVSKPEPFYTDEAKRNQVEGMVVFKAVLSTSGKVINIELVKGLKYGLTEIALEAAGKLKFVPAVKDGNFVSQYVRLEYHFNLY